MASLRMLDDIAVVNLPLQSANKTETNMNKDSPQYQYPILNFNSEWKDCVFAIAFGINTILVIVLGIVSGIFITSESKGSFSYQDVKSVVYELTIVAIIGGLASVLTLVILQLCAGILIQISFFIIITMQIIVAVILYFIYWPLCFIPGIFLCITSIYLACVRNRISFAQANLEAGCASLRSHLSLILIAIVMLFAEFIWSIFWSLMIIGIITMTVYLPIKAFILYLSLVSWYWFVTTFQNINHFITACSVGHWWFSAEISEQYTIKSSIKRAFTTNLGTICFGSLFVALIKALRWLAERDCALNIFSCIFSCILRLMEKLIGYLNEWAFVFTALTGQGFVQASQNVIDLFQKHGWTTIINDSLIKFTLIIISIAISLISAAAGTLTVYSIRHQSSDPALLIMVFLISFIFGLFISTTVTTILKSSVHTIFVCFALNPVALRVKHPDYLKKLTTAWHKFHPQEFALSGYTNQFIESTLSNAYA